MKEIKLHYTEPLLREAVRSYFFRAVRLRLFLALALVLACDVYAFMNGDRGWYVASLTTVLLFTCIFFIIIYLAHFRNTVGRFREMRASEATFSYTEENLTLSSELGSSTLPWTAIKDIWRYQHFWLILFSTSSFATFPLDGFDTEALEFITRKTDENKPPPNGKSA